MPKIATQPPAEVELKFFVPQKSTAALAAEMARGPAGGERTSLAALYLDTTDRRLARAGLAWRLRREGRRWIQTLKAPGANPLERFEHEVIRPGATHDASLHAGSAAGDHLLRILRGAQEEQVEVGVRFQTEIRRTLRKLRTQGAVVEIAFDEGRLLSNESSLRIREVEFELVSGSTAAMLALAERWRKRFNLIYEPRTKSERGDQLAAGALFPPVRKARRPQYPRQATAVVAFGSVLDECLDQVTRNATGLCDGDPASRVEHIHQLRVGIRRLRSALRSFEGWTPDAPDALVDDLRRLFSALGQARDSDVLATGVAAELVKVGAPALTLPAHSAAADPVDTVRAGDTQRSFLAWIAWRMSLAEPPVPAAGLQDPQEEAATEPRQFRRDVERRLGRWHRRIVADWKSFDDLDEDGLHSLRKRIKRQRYALEFFAPMLGSRSMDRYLKPLGDVQDRMGQLNDLFVARARYQLLVATDPAAWFALGWIAARIAEVRAQAKQELAQLAATDPPTR